MSTVTNTQLVEQRLGRWAPSDLAFIEVLEYCCSKDDEASQLRLIAMFQRRDTSKKGWPSDDESFIKVVILFNGVVDLQLKAFGASPKQIVGFDIVDVSDQGLEGIRFQVEDYEDDQISFACHDITIEDVK